MRICFIIHQATKEGAGRFLLDQIDYLKKKNASVFAIVPALGPLCEALNQREVEFKVIKNPWWIKGAFINIAIERVVTLRAARAMADMFLEWNIDLVYTQTIVVPAGALAAAMAGKPHVWHIHEFSYNSECIEMAIPQLELAKLLDSTSNLIVFNSSAVASEWSGLLPAAKTKIVRNWLNPKAGSENEKSVSEFKPGSERFEIAMVASVLPWKRQMDAVQAMDSLIQDHPNVFLSIVGPLINDKYHDELVTFINEHQLQKHIRFLGYIENPETIVKSSHVTVICSRLEPFGRVTIESMMHGIPVVGSNSGGTTEIIEDEVSGLLYPVGDSNALANQLRRLIKNEDFRQCLSKNAVKRAVKFSSAENEMDPLFALFPAICKTPNPSWPLGEILGTLKNPNPLIPKVSIIIPTYRHRDFILRTLDSVFSQTMQDYEIIVVNDGSPDDTKAVLAPLIKSNYIQYFEQENKGQSHARNQGIKLARGEYIAFLDDDDVWPEDKLEWQAAFLDKNPDVALVGGVLQTMDEHGKPAWKGNFHPSITFESLFAENPFLSPGQTLIRAEVLKKLGGMNANIWGADDWDLLFRIVKKNKIVMLDRLALHYRLHPGNASKQVGRLIEGACVTVEIHLKDAPPHQEKVLRRTAHGMLYRGLGTLLIANAKKQLRRARPLRAMRSLWELRPLRDGILFEPAVRRHFLKEILPGSLKRWWRGKKRSACL